MGVKSIGVECPIIRKGDNIVDIVVDSIFKKVGLNGLGDNDVIGITESVIARANGLYVTLNEIVDFLKKNYGERETVYVINPIYSRNRFSLILKAIARYAKERVVIIMPDYDEVGNPNGENPFTGIDIMDFYENLVEEEGASCFFDKKWVYTGEQPDELYIYAGLHDYNNFRRKYTNHYSNIITLADICNDRNSDYGLLGSNKATEESLKLFPTQKMADEVCEEIKRKIRALTFKETIVCCYGDGCFKDPVGGIWEFADPITMPGYTNKELIESSPNEIKLKAIIDQSDSNKDVEQILKSKESDLKGKMLSQGTTPRVYRDLLASLMDLTSGSGDRGTPVVLIQGYFR